MGAALQDYFASGRCAERCGNDDPVAVPHGAYRCGDGAWVALSCWSDADFVTLAKAMGEPTLADDPHFASVAARRANVEALDATITAWTETQRAEAVAEILQAVGV